MVWVWVWVWGGAGGRGMLGVILLVLIRASVCSGEFYSSTDDMMELVVVEKNLIQSLRDSITAQERCLEMLNRALRVSQRDPEPELDLEDPEDLEQHISNPLIAYKLLRRMRRTWAATERADPACTSHDFLSRLAGRLPGDGDVDGAALSLDRLHHLYTLPLGFMGGPGLDPDEAFHVATVALQNHKYQNAVRWLQETLRQLESGVVAVVTRREVLGYLGPLAFQMGSLPLALELTQLLLDLDPTDMQTLAHLTYYRTLRESLQPGGQTSTHPALREGLQPGGQTSTHPALREGLQPGGQTSTHPALREGLQPGGQTSTHPALREGLQPGGQTSTHPALREGLQPGGQTSTHPALREGLQPGGQTSTHPAGLPDLSALLKPPGRSSYESLCRGQGITMTPSRRRRLLCRFSTGGGQPGLLLSPIREEQEWDHPPIFRYHQLLSDTEMDTIKRLARSKLARAKVSDHLTGSTFSAEVRVAKSAWLSDGEDPVLSRVTQRMSDVSGLDMDAAEMLQVANYGIGGQYEPHYDSKLANDSDYQTRGGRIATILIYMSDVEVGGATVFPGVGASLQPQKGSAVLWYNLLPSGEEDARTLHAGCPVFLGNKWVANKWVRARGQEFRRRCPSSRTD